MSRHPGRNEILQAFIHEFKGKGREKLRAHIESCEECSSYLARLQAHVAPGAISREEPRRRVLARILQSRAEMQPAAGLRATLKSLPVRRMTAALAGMSIMVCAALTALFWSARGPGDPSIAITECKGAASLSGRAAVKGGVLVKGAELATLSGATATIAFNEHFTVELAPETALAIEESMYDAGKKRYVFAFNLMRGSVHSRFIHRNIPKEYSFLTPHARIDSIGTDFILKADDAHTILELKEGSLRLTSLHDGKTVQGTAGTRYDVSATIASTPLDAPDAGVAQGLPGRAAAILTNDSPDPRKRTTPPALDKNGDRMSDIRDKKEVRREQREMIREERRERQEMRREQRELLRESRKERPNRPGR